MRREALTTRMGVGDLHRRSAAGRCSWGQPCPGGAGEGGGSPDKAGTCQYCQMVWVRQAWRKGVRGEPALLRPL